MTHKDFDDEQSFADEAGGRLRDANERLDAATLSRLNQARQIALAELDGERRSISIRWLPAGALAASALIATALWLGRESPVVGPLPGIEPETDLAAGQFEDLDILLSDDDFELYDELEFYSWLDGELDVLDEDRGQG